MNPHCGFQTINMDVERYMNTTGNKVSMHTLEWSSIINCLSNTNKKVLDKAISWAIKKIACVSRKLS